MKTSAPSSTRWNHLPAFCAALRQPPFEVDAERLKVLLVALHPVPFLPPGVAFPPAISPNITLGGRCSPMRATKPANKILRLRIYCRPQRGRRLFREASQHRIEFGLRAFVSAYRGIAEESGVGSSVACRSQSAFARAPRLVPVVQYLASR